MKKNMLWTIPFLLTVGLGTAQAEGMKCGAGKCGGAMQQKSGVRNGLLHEVKEKDSFRIVLESQKPLTVGNNDITVTVMHNGQKRDNVKVKIKFFMPEMPGMPYMEYKTKLKKANGVYKGSVNLSMGGTWQYQLKFKDAEGKVHSVRGSVNM